MTLISSTTTVSPVIPSSAPRRPLGLDEVQITGGYWRQLQSVNGANTLPHIRHWLEREGWIANFDLAASGGLAEGRRGREFSDSEVYKYLEAAAWELGRVDDPALESDFRSIVSRIAAAQEVDGYIGTRFGHPGQSPRWSDMEWGHELYCLGHLFQAVVARLRTKPDANDGLAEIGLHAADLVCKVFGKDGMQTICGHAEVETALVELGRATGQRRYIEQAQLFIERRGTHVLIDPPFGREYYQDDLPVSEATVLRGHAVRANYLAAGAADVADETVDVQLRNALDSQWNTTAARRTYVTGGQGSRHTDEAFGADYELPADRAYSETCAGVASIQFSWRMLLAAPDGTFARYGDLIERTLYNVVATSPSSDGRAFYYANTLHQREPGTLPDRNAASTRAQSSVRAAWFDVSCCPPNVARTLASLAAYVATVDESGVQLHQYMPSRIRTTLANGTPIDLDIATGYPSTGAVTVKVRETATFTLTLRVPEWAVGATLDGNHAEPGTIDIRRNFVAGDKVVLELPVAPRLVRPNHQIDAIRGTVAVERGPEVMCLESVDLASAGLGEDVGEVTIDPLSQPVERNGTVLVRLSVAKSDKSRWPYRRDWPQTDHQSAEVPLIAYHDWAERGASTMRIWLPCER